MCKGMATKNNCGVGSMFYTPRGTGSKKRLQNKVACLGLLKHILHMDHGHKQLGCG